MKYKECQVAFMFKDRIKHSNLVFWFLFLLSLCTGCGSAGGGASITGPQATVTSGQTTLSITLDKTEMSLNDTLTITLEFSCTCTLPEGSYTLSYSTNARLTPTSASTANAVAEADANTLTGFKNVFSGLAAASKGTAEITASYTGTVGNTISTSTTINIQ